MSAKAHILLCSVTLFSATLNKPSTRNSLAHGIENAEKVSRGQSQHDSGGGRLVCRGYSLVTLKIWGFIQLEMERNQEWFGLGEPT